MTLTYDMTIAVILLSSLYERIPELEKHRCKIHPVKKQMMQRNEITSYAAAMNFLLAYYHMEDDWQDEKKFGRHLYGSVLKVKSIKAKEKEIPMQVTTLLPQRVSVDIGDMGVLYGNLLDNAIEAAMAVEQEKRYVHVESKFQEGRLLLSIKNSKPSGTCSYQQTNKKDKINHGRGIRSVRKVAEKYGG